MKMSEIYYSAHYVYRKNARSKHYSGNAQRVRVVRKGITITTGRGTQQPRGVKVEWLNPDGSAMSWAGGYRPPDVVPSDDIVEPWTAYQTRNASQISAQEQARLERETAEQQVHQIGTKLFDSFGIKSRANVHNREFSISADDVERLMQMAIGGAGTVVEKIVPMEIEDMVIEIMPSQKKES